MKWTNKEEQLLRSIYATATAAELHEVLPQHSRGAINTRAAKLGLRKANRLHDRSPIIQTLIDQRHSLGFSQAEVARRTNICRSQISRFESGLHDPSLPTLHNICAALGFELFLRQKEETA